MSESGAVHNLDDLLDALERAAGESDRVSVADVHETVGVRSFGPLLLAAGLIGLTPVGGIPGVPTALAAIVVLIAAQLLLGLQRFWLPGFIRRRSVTKARLQKGIGWLRPVTRAVDKLLRPRLVWLTAKPATHGIAAVCIVLALAMPPLEFVPFAGGMPAGAVTLFGLGLIARDGIVILLATALTAASFFFATNAF